MSNINSDFGRQLHLQLIRDCLRNELSLKDMSYVAEILEVQKDPLIDVKALEDLYISTCIALGVVV